MRFLNLRAGLLMAGALIVTVAQLAIEQQSYAQRGPARREERRETNRPNQPNAPQAVPNKTLAPPLANPNAAADRAREAAKQAENAKGDAARDARREGQDRARDAQRDANQTAREAKDKARDTTRDANRQAREANDKARDATRDANRQARDNATDRRDDRRDDRQDNQRDRQANREDNRDARRANLGATFGASRDKLTIDRITDNSAAARLGLRSGDQLVSVNGTTIADDRAFHDQMNRAAQGSRNGRIPIIVRRDGALRTLYWTSVALGMAGYGPYGYYNGRYGYNPGYYNNGPGYAGYGQQTPYQTGYRHSNVFLGVTFDPSYRNSAVVQTVEARSPADEAGIRAGDVVERLNGREVRSYQDVINAIGGMQPNDKLEISVSALNGQERHTVTATLRARDEVNTQANNAEAPAPQADTYEGDGANQ